MMRFEHHGWRRGVAGLLLLTLGVGGAGPATAGAQPATPPCETVLERDEAARIVTLASDCATGATIVVGAGWSFEGAGHTIFALDPPGSAFRSAVIERQGGEGDVSGVTIDGSRLVAPCDGDSEITGITMQSATGTVSEVSINHFWPQGERSCAIGIQVSGHPLQAEPSSPVVIRDSTLTRIGHWSIALEAGANAEVRGVTIRDGKDVGIAAVGASTRLVAADNTLINPGLSGIGVTSGARAEIVRNKISGAEHSGIYVHSDATAAPVTGNQVRVVNFGIVVVGAGANAALSRNELAGSGTGLAVSQSGTATSTGDTFTGPFAVGILVENAGALRIADARLAGAKFGLNVVGEASQLTVSGGEYQAVESALQVQELGSATVDGASLTSGWTAVSATSARLLLTNSEVMADTFGVFIFGPGATGVIRGSTITMSPAAGANASAVSIGLGATGSVIENRIAGPAINGITLHEATGEIAIQGNTITGVTMVGITAGIEDPDDPGTVAITGNTVTGVPLGILSFSTALVEISGNQVTGSSAEGISVSTATGAIIAGNVVDDVSGVGIRVIRSEGVVIAANSISAASDPASGATGIEMEDLSGGQVQTNRISGFRPADGTGCGMRGPAAGAGVAFVANTYPDPGNDRDNCPGH